MEPCDSTDLTRHLLPGFACVSECVRNTFPENSTTPDKSCNGPLAQDGFRTLQDFPYQEPQLCSRCAALKVDARSQMLCVPASGPVLRPELFAQTLNPDWRWPHLETR